MLPHNLDSMPVSSHQRTRWGLIVSAKTRLAFTVGGCCLLCGILSSCACGIGFYGYQVEGQFIDAAPELGEITDLRCSINRQGETIEIGLIPFPLESTDGRFQIWLPENVCESCKFLGLIGPSTTGCDDPRTLTVPDQFECTVRREQCQQRIVVDLNEETVLDTTYPENIIELRLPIVGNACDE